LSSRPGRPRLGNALKQSYTVALEPLVADRLRSLGCGNLSAGIAVAEFQARGSTLPRKSARAIAPPWVEPGWIVFELTDGPADPPRPGEQIEPFRDCLPP
jgi:hypothetical protein